MGYYSKETHDMVVTCQQSQGLVDKFCNPFDLFDNFPKQTNTDMI